jgi:hypothetical protein
MLVICYDIVNLNRPYDSKFMPYEEYVEMAGKPAQRLVLSDDHLAILRVGWDILRHNWHKLVRLTIQFVYIAMILPKVVFFGDRSGFVVE